ncbi:metal ABC transporter substrate-binding protein [Streptococcaceae bacterium ESL0687]|nr:metal ABC transporter substrate-binding protein [Streptococcaceae bacterium ESL0687]
MFKKLSYLGLALISLIGLSACSKDKDTSSDKINVVASYSIIGDMVKNVGGDKVEVNNIVPVGVDPHSYEPTPEDSKKMDKADLVFYNGFNLETAKGWFEKMLVNSRKEDRAYELTMGVTPLYLTEDSSEKTEDPHAWLNIQNGIKYVENIKDQLVSYDAKNKDVYEKNAASYIAKLQKLDEEGAKKLLEIPEERRVLVTSEGAFKYFAKRYGMDAEYIWEINTDNQGTPEQMVRIDDIVKDRNVPALFVETSVSPKTMEAVARNTGRKIASKLFTDSLAKEGQKGDSYYEMMEWNINKIYEGLK